MGFPWWLSNKESACNAGDLGWENPLEVITYAFYTPSTHAYGENLTPTQINNY